MNVGSLASVPTTIPIQYRRSYVSDILNWVRKVSGLCLDPGTLDYLEASTAGTCRYFSPLSQSIPDL